MKILILDNFDSFTYNLYQLVGEVLQSRNEIFRIDVVRNDAVNLKEIESRRYDRIIISPGPGSPSQKKYFGVCGQVLKTISQKVPTLGVCLGMQGIAHVYGGQVTKARRPMHGKVSIISHDGSGLFASIPQKIEVMRYHSLVTSNLPNAIEVSARVSNNEYAEIMALRHKHFPIEGIQFHPESFMTECGKTMIESFLFKPYNPLNI